VALSGKIGIVTEELEGVKREVILSEGDCFTIPPNRWHEFRIYEDSDVIEEMYVRYDELDIQRDKIGGII
jgi:mannose-6-phosphate isomerase-like protein (cupin superfamily)